MPLITLMKAGTLSEYAIENDADAVIANWAQQADQPAGWRWADVQQYEPVREGTLVEAMDGTVGAQGGASGKIEWFRLTPNMIDYLWTNLFEQSFSNAVTFKTYHQRRGDVIYNCRLYWVQNWRDDAVEHADGHYSNVRFRYKRASVAVYGRSYSSGYDAGYG